MGQGIPLHLRFLHVAHLRIGRPVTAHENDLEIILVRVAELNQIRSERPAWRAPMGGKVESYRFPSHFLPVESSNSSGSISANPGLMAFFAGLALGEDETDPLPFQLVTMT